MTKQHQWSQKRPTEPGWYWYYGDAFAGGANFDPDPELAVAQVWKIANGFAYLVNHNFIDERKELPGWWLPLDTPDLPDVITQSFPSANTEKGSSA